MRISNLLLATWLAVGSVTALSFDGLERLDRRQGNSNNGNDLPKLGSETSSTSSSPPATTTASATSSTGAASSGSGTASSVPTTSSSQTISATSISSLAPTLSPTPTAAARGNQTHLSESIPLDPGITPALSIGGVILILTGIGYALVGVKNRWIHVSLSTAYLTSLSVCVLIVYVMNPPVSNAIQGAYFVGILMTGLIFGAGALIFQEVTEGLGCLLGGFCLAMWFLTLKSGGLLPTTTGTAIFIAIFCTLAWSLSFSHITRPYALIGATSFSGATALVLGIDCFARAGLKEFWLYIWNLNPDLFPLDTTVYPITRGARVETIMIVLGCIIGIISQLKIWKVVKDRQTKRANALQEDARRQDAVEAALGRHLEMRNDRDKSEWEKQYGNLLHAKRDTILWSDAHREKKTYSRISEAEVGDALNSPSTDSLEMNSMPQAPRSIYVARVKRQSTLAVDTIDEVDEAGNLDEPPRTSQVQDSNRLSSSYTVQNGSRLSLLTSGQSPRLIPSQESLRSESKRQSYSTAPRTDKRSSLDAKGSKRASQLLEHKTLKVGSRASYQIPGSDGHSPAVSEALHERTGAEAPSQGYSQSRDPQRLSPAESAQSRDSQFLDAPGKGVKQRRSWSSMFSKSSAVEKEHPSINASQEALVEPAQVGHHSRASSVAATLDSDNEIRDFNLDTSVSHAERPGIVISAVQSPDSAIELPQRKNIDDVPAPPALEEEEFDADPEELVRPYTGHGVNANVANRQSSSVPESSKAHGGAESEVGTEILFDEHPLSHTGTTNTSFSDVLTKGALEKVPNHLSNVVLSYRTNEWAKHASRADAPLYEEPEILGEEDVMEEPAHLASPEEAQKHTVVVQPPPLSHPPTAASRNSFHEAATTSPTEGVKVNPIAQPVQQSLRSQKSNETIQATSTPVEPQSVQPQLPIPRTRSGSELGRNNSATRGLRSSSTPMLIPNLVNSPIDENAAVNFGPYNANRATSALSVNRLSADSTHAVSRAPSGYFGSGPQPYGGVYPNVGVAQQSGSRFSLVSDSGQGPLRSASQLSLGNPLMGGRSETRMVSYDSHQPSRRNTNAESQRREALFADWRMSQQKNTSQADLSEARHAQRIFEKIQEKHIKENEKTIKAQQEIQLDVAMRGRDMQDAHREAMRRMQAGANKKLTK